MVVHRLVARAMPERHRDAVAARPAGGPDAAVRDRANGRARGRAVVDREVRTHAAEDRMRPRPREPRGDARELERRLQEALAQRAALQIIEREPSVAGTLEADAAEHTAVADVLRHEDAPVVDERVVGEALLDEQPEAIARARVRREVEVGLEDRRQLHRELRRPTRVFHRLEERAGHLARHDVHPHVTPRLRAPHLPAAVGGDHHVAEPRARLVAQRHRPSVERRGDFERVARRELLEIRAAGRERGGDPGARLAFDPLPRERANERVAAADVDRGDAGDGRGWRGRLGDDGRQGRRREGLRRA